MGNLSGRYDEESKRICDANPFCSKSNFWSGESYDNCQTTILAQSLIVGHKKDSCGGTFNKYSQDVFQVQVCWSPGERGVQRLTKQERANNLLIEVVVVVVIIVIMIIIIIIIIITIS